MSVSERFVVEKHAKKKLADRREILEKTDGYQTQMPRRVTEPEEWDGGDDARAHEQDRQPPPGAAEDQRVGALKVNEKNNREREQ